MELLEKDLMNRILHYDINAFNSENSAKYISILNNDVRKIDEMVFRLLHQTAGNVICAKAYAWWRCWSIILERTDLRNNHCAAISPSTVHWQTRSGAAEIYGIPGWNECGNQGHLHWL